VAVRRCRLREDPSGGPLDALRRRGTRLRLVAARHGTGLVTADGDIAARSQHKCHLWPRRPSLRDDDRPGGFSRPGGRARGGCRASGPIRRFTRASPTRAGRVDVTASGCDPRRQRRLRPARCRRRGQGQYLGACARWRGRRSRCSSVPPSHCAWPPWTACPSCPLPHASRCARGLRHAYSPRARRRRHFSIPFTLGGPGTVAAALRQAGSVSSLWLMPVWSGKDCCR